MSLACLVSSKESRMAGGMSKGPRLRDEMRLESRTGQIRQDLVGKVRSLEFIPNAVRSVGGL